MSIELLPPQLANQIAAGEVVERPASVVKELVENSIDAGATKIEVEIYAGGHKQILIRDNGAGIPREELELALSRHATSKIKTLDDLEAIESMGFRGEALASISSVSRLTLTSKTAAQNEAWQAHAEGRDMGVRIEPAAHPTGTSIDVKDLFFNTPARRRFLRTEKTEFGHIELTFTRLALANQAIEFTLKHNGKRVKHLKASNDIAVRLNSAVAGLKKHDLLPFEVEAEGISLRGIFVEPASELKQDIQFSFVNYRPMRDKLINHAIRQAYEQLGLDDVQPAFVLFVSVSPIQVDVNVHPAKHEVRFHHARQVHDFIVSTTRNLIASSLGNSEIQFQGIHESTQPSHDYIVAPRASTASSGISSYNQPVSRPNLGKETRIAAQNYQNLVSIESSQQTSFEILSIDSEIAIVKDIAAEKLFSITWQEVHRHRLLSELKQIKTSQPLLMPVAISAVPIWSEAMRQQFEALHFQIDKVVNKLILKQVPAGWRNMPWSMVFSEMLSEDSCNDEQIVNYLCNSKATSFSIEQGQHWLLSSKADDIQNFLSTQANEINVDVFKQFLES